MRNPLTAWTKGHELIASHSEKVEGLTATPVFNKPQDLIGISTAMDLPAKYKIASTWFRDRQKTAVNLDTIHEFHEYTDRVTDDILNLPPITDHYVDFDANIDPLYVDDYNEALASARRLRISLERRGRATQQEMQKLMSYLQTLQQFVVSPLLAEKGAKAMQADKELIEQASRQDTGALLALKRSIVALQDEGFARVMVAVCHTSLMAVAEAYLARECPEVGTLICYHGGLSLKRRGEAVQTFLTDEKTVMLMSIDAGGTGLHLVPGANAVIFWGSRPFSPMQVKQTKKRVHRIGQEFAVKVVHLIAKGSVDSAIDYVHRDKLTLARAVMDNDTGTLAAKGGKWRTAGRIVDRCRFLTQDGRFAADEDPEEALTRLEAAATAGPSTGPSSNPATGPANWLQSAFAAAGYNPLTNAAPQGFTGTAAHLFAQAAGLIGNVPNGPIGLPPLQ